MRQRLTKLFSLLAVCFMLAAYCTTAQAALKAVGPLDLPAPPGNGFPTWYQDANNLALVPCLSQTLLPSGNNACVLPPTEPGWILGNPVVFPTNYPFEVFYFIADVLGPLTAPLGSPLSSFVYRAALESTFGTVAPAPGGQVTFTRIRMRMDAPVAGLYTITHPYGVETFNVTTPGIKAINMTRDLGITPFPTGPLTGDFTTWLVRKSTAPVYPFLNVATGETFIGDFNVIGPVTGSPTGNNFVRIAGPVGSNLDGAGNSTVTISDFAVAGKVFTGQIPSPLTIDSTTYARDAATGQVDAFVTATPTASLALSGTGLPAVTWTQNILNNGKFFTHIPLATSTLPTSLNITNSLDIPPILHPVTLVDEVNITQARYNPVTRDLTIMAASRDKFTPPTLTVPALAAPNTIIAGTLVKAIPLNSIPPLTVTVNSTLGGSATLPVSVVTPPAPPVAVADSATTIGTAPVVIDVLLNDTLAVNIDPATVAIVTPGTGATSIGVNPINGAVTFTPNAAAVAAGTASFTYRVFDIFGQPSLPATVIVTVTAPAATLPPAPPTPPLAIADTVKITPCTVTPCAAVTIPVLANDTIVAPGVINPTTVAIVTAPLSGAAVSNLDGTVTYTPVVGFTGLTTFTYTVNDSLVSVLNPTGQTSNQALVTVNVAANIPPVANPDVSSTFVGVARIINVKANDTDADGTIAAGPVTLVIQPTTATLVPNADGTVTFTPNLAGTYTFTYNVRDNLGAPSNDATVTVSVTSPVTDSITVLKAEYNTATGQWLVEGSTTGVSPLSKTVTIHLGKDLTGQIIGTSATTAADGRWKFGFSFGAGVLAPALLDRTISVALPSGASRLAFPVAVK